MIDALSTPRNTLRTLILLIICGLLAAAAVAVGIDDNPPGIVLAYLAAIALILGFAHSWRTLRQFRQLLYASFLGLIVFGLLHNIFEAMALKVGSSGLVPSLLNGAGGALFLIAVLLCPAGLLVGASGIVILFIRNHLHPPHGPRTAG